MSECTGKRIMNSGVQVVGPAVLDGVAEVRVLAVGEVVGGNELLLQLALLEGQAGGFVYTVAAAVLPQDVATPSSHDADVDHHDDRAGGKALDVLRGIVSTHHLRANNTADGVENVC